MKQIGIFLFFCGIIFILIGYMEKKLEKCSPIPQIQYKFIPRTLEEEETNPVKPTDLFDFMFYDQQPWMYNMAKDFKPVPLRENFNEYYISSI